MIKDIADVDEKDSKGNSRLHNAVHLGNIEIAEVLLERGVAIDVIVEASGLSKSEVKKLKKE